jgi:exonuclease VII small subunit
MVQDTMKKSDKNEEELAELKEYVKQLEERIANLESTETNKQ